VPAGTHRLAAFVDINRDFTDQPGVDPSALLHAGEPIRGEETETPRSLYVLGLRAGRA
jgi:hypothetical protein